MDLQSLFNWGLTLGVGVSGWLLRTMYDAIRTLERDFAVHKEIVARDYATNADLQRIDGKLDRILERLGK